MNDLLCRVVISFGFVIIIIVIIINIIINIIIIIIVIIIVIIIITQIYLFMVCPIIYYVLLSGSTEKIRINIKMEDR
jgi:hypothetical protein